MVEPAKRDTKHRCEIFHCDRRRDRYCCFYCHMKESCKIPASTARNVAENHP